MFNSVMYNSAMNATEKRLHILSTDEFYELYLDNKTVDLSQTEPLK